MVARFAFPFVWQRKQSDECFWKRIFITSPSQTLYKCKHYCSLSLKQHCWYIFVYVFTVFFNNIKQYDNLKTVLFTALLCFCSYFYNFNIKRFKVVTFVTICSVSINNVHCANVFCTASTYLTLQLFKRQQTLTCLSSMSNYLPCQKKKK